MATLGPLPDHGTEHEISKADGFEALRWAGDAPVIIPDPPLNWRDVPVLTHPLGVVPLVWHCPYCGKVNPESALACGQGEWDGCGAQKPGCNEPPKGVLQLREFGSFYVVEEQ